MPQQTEQPMQPVVMVDDVIRFRKNALVRHLLDHGTDTGCDMNALYLMDFPDEDRRQFAQLIGYSVDGYGGLSYVTAESYLRADVAACSLAAAQAKPQEYTEIPQCHEYRAPKPCPFCGFTAMNLEGYHLSCIRCGADGPDGDEDSITSATAKWNQRAGARGVFDVDLGSGHDLQGSAMVRDGKPVTDPDAMLVAGLLDHINGLSEQLGAAAPDQRELPSQVNAWMEQREQVQARPSSPAPVCSCPSGDGSLRFPCEVHPPAPSAAEPVAGAEDMDLTFAVTHARSVLEEVQMYGGEDLGPSMWQQITNAIEFCDRALAAPPAPQSTSSVMDEKGERTQCIWCCGTGRFSDHACRLCAGRATLPAAQPEAETSAEKAVADPADKTAGSWWHLAMLMAPHHLNLVVGDDRQKLLLYARDVWKAAKADAPVAEPVAFTDEHVSYVARFGGFCRDCADEAGVCPGSGLPCGNSDKAIRHVFKAISYGVKHGFIGSPLARPPAPEAVAKDAARKPMSEAELIKLWQSATVAHGQHSSFNWFAAGLRTAERVYGIAKESA